MKIKTGRQFRSYVISWFLMLVGAIVVWGASSLYHNAENYLLTSYKQNKLEQLQAISMLIDGDKHHLLKHENSTKEPIYHFLVNAFSNIQTNQQSSQQIFSINYDKKRKHFKTAVDNQKSPFDLIQIISPLFEFSITKNTSNNIQFFYADNYVNILEFEKENRRYYIQLLKKENQTTLLINKKEILTINNNNLFDVYQKKSQLNLKKHQSKYHTIPLEKNIKLQYRFVTKGHLLNLPGKIYVTSKSFKNSLLQSMANKSSSSVLSNNETIKHSDLIVWSPIITRKNENGGMVVLKMKSNVIEKIADDFFQSVLLGFSLFTILLMLAAIFFARKITDPLEQLTSAITRLINEDFNFKLSPRGFGSFGFIAEQFNLMLNKIDLSRKDLIQMNRAYSRFVPHQLLKQLSASNINDISLGDCCEKEMTVLFCDIRGFTTLSETMSPQANFLFINRYLSQIAPVINRQGGIIDKYLGDGIMALFPSGANSALNAAIDMLTALDQYNKKLIHKNLPTIKVGLGLHSGKMMLGTVGTHSRMDATVISDTVNAAARVESMTKVFCTKILITEETKRQLTTIDQYKTRFIATCQIQGKSKPVTLYEVFNNDTISLQKEKERNQSGMIQAWNTYKNGDAIMAILMYQKLIEKSASDKSLFALVECCEKGRL